MRNLNLTDYDLLTQIRNCPERYIFIKKKIIL
ncbi:hypothetical protein HDEF_1198 [Candidatus Hamiltonella defensa 5AT (Acyrthosiphon pisum)]|uniref:Uncharacterized protein n=1 Tax=Hamiltonella defensa subsp. Acyrthosiphon pisum (strain 5AT) TaxID=572265 RepID=C4K5L4_HAMD5|nr:hypothetical protein HDEF_1198 [Candidatus Hamiltonella defensa 5AT (Acyrthosiphon pisum)]